MEKYRQIHLWMILPMLIMQLGIFMNYWGDFSNKAWSVHVHYWTGTFWYLYLIVQPYLATHGYLDKHRTNGMIGFLLAGGVVFTALSMNHRNILLAETVAQFPDQFGPFEPWFFYGVIAIETVMMLSFLFAIIQGIIHRKSLEDHAWWMISTVFLIIWPALSRGILIAWYGPGGFIDEPTAMPPFHFTSVFIIILIVIAAWKYKKLKHPATILALAVNFFNFLLEPIGRSSAFRSFIDLVIKG
ncbi:hypothetical protein [Robiginitalea sp. SC105]|uniref:hypothetical protein n=1 Tax=Robiginitalea sp. SC105 TaxID=2762332 RepID=UPI00163AA0B7|nr:hypothetical protein [Robiginitalea sp. SC105]MBC2838620.1 hypothetical protein [Robiginitalea sp. SC105]